MPEIYYQEDKKQYRKRVLFYQVISILILPPSMFIYYDIFVIDFHLLKGDVLIVIIIAFLILIPTNIYMPLRAFSYRMLIIKSDRIYPPKVPFRYITKKDDYTIDYNDIIWFKVTASPKGDIEGVLIKHPDFYIIDIHIPEFPKEAVMATINQLKNKVGQKEKGSRKYKWRDTREVLYTIATGVRENILTSYKHAGFDTPDNNIFFRSLPQSDKGELLITDKRLYFKGEKNKLSIDKEKILDISTQNAKGIAGVSYVQITHNQFGKIETIYFLGHYAPHPVWEIRRLTDELNDFLVTWHKS